MEASSEAAGVTNEQEKKDDKYASDAELQMLWGKLQDHIPLEIVYEKLSPDDLLRLRLVCKAWNHRALQRLLAKPSFVTITLKYSLDDYELRYLNGIVTYDVVSHRFRFYRHRFPLIKVRNSRRFRDVGVRCHVPPFETEGLILCHNPDDFTQRGVFNVHTQTWHVIPPPPPTQCKSLSACGLMVDKSLKPYTFKLIEGNLDIDTRIYDSKTRSWSTTSSRLLQAAHGIDYAPIQYTCICNNGYVYISLGSLSQRGGQRGRFMILKYSMEDDLWTTLRSPKVQWDKENNPRPDNSLGVWEGRIFTTRENYKEQRVTVWELVDSERQIWEVYAHTTKEHYDWLWSYCYLGMNGPFISKNLCLRSFFRDGYLLIALWRLSSGRADALIMFNMATKKWQTVRLPMSTVAIEEREPVRIDNLSDSDDESGEG